MRDLDELRKIAEEATPGEWMWRGNVDNQEIRLTTRSKTVMDFVRWGMRCAAPRFQVDGLMDRADEMVTFEVARHATSRKDPKVYRGDIVDIRHPDAQFIAAANPSAVLELLAEVDRLRAEAIRYRDERDVAEGEVQQLGVETDRLRAELEKVTAERDQYVEDYEPWTAKP